MTSAEQNTLSLPDLEEFPSRSCCQGLPWPWEHKSFLTREEGGLATKGSGEGALLSFVRDRWTKGDHQQCPKSKRVVTSGCGAQAPPRCAAALRTVLFARLLQLKILGYDTLKVKKCE